MFYLTTHSTHFIYGYMASGLLTENKERCENGRDILIVVHNSVLNISGARCSSVVRAFAGGAMGRRIDPSWGGPIELFLVPASAPQLV